LQESIAMKGLIARLRGAAETGATLEPGADSGETQCMLYFLLRVVSSAA
jgi:hypothetical protein